MLALGYTYGFRRAEMLKTRVGQVDLLARTIRLNPGETKNDDGRLVALTAECYDLVLQTVRGKQADNFLLTRSNGKPIKDFRVTWDTLTRAAGLPGPHLHDLRRSAVRNMARRGVTEQVPMHISGHKTASVFRRYDIMSEADLAEAALKVESGAKAELARANEIHSACAVEQTEDETQHKGDARKAVQ
jgi:integrase